MIDHIKMEDCIDGGLYRIFARNFSLGVYRKDSKGFIGVREKFGFEYLFTEYHWDTGPPCGTVNPKLFLEMCPVIPVAEGFEVEKDGEKSFHQNKLLFDWLKEREEFYKEELRNV